MNECSCGKDFASVAAFDCHRVGSFLQQGPADYLDRLRAGLVDPLEDWTAEMGRRCLDADELAGAGLEQDGNGRWRVKPTAAQRAFFAIQSAAAASKASGHTRTSPQRKAA